MEPKPTTVMVKVEAENMKELRTWGSLAVSGKIVPIGTTVEQAMAIVQVGKEYGLPPFHALRSFYFVNGRLCSSAAFMLAQVRKHGIKVEVIESTDTKCTMRFTRPDEEPIDISWTIEDAKRAGLVRPQGNWEKYPRQMLRARVETDGARLTDDSCAGIYTKEELETVGEISETEIDPTKRLEGGLKEFTQNLGNEKKTVRVDPTTPEKEILTEAETPKTPKMTPNTPKLVKTEYISSAMVLTLQGNLKTIGYDEEELCMDLNIENLSKLPLDRVVEAKDWIENHRKEQSK